MRFPRDKRPPNVNALRKWISTWAMQEGVAQDRVQRWIAFELIAAAFEAAGLDAGEPLFLLKGGFAMEVRLGLEARATKDLDAMLRGGTSADEIIDSVRAALAEPRCDGLATFEVVSAHKIGTSEMVRFDVRVMWAGQVLSRMRLEVSPHEGPVGDDAELVDLASRAADFGITDVPESVTCLPLRFQIAQKLHAVTDPREDNDRFRDLIDLQLLDAVHDRARDPDVLSACRATFASRATHDWPPSLPLRHEWREGYSAMARDLELLADFDVAVAQVGAMIRRLDAGA